MDKDDMEPKCKVCVTGGSGYIASWLIMKLLVKGYTVHATLRTLEDKGKVGVLKRLPGAETRLKLFEADMNKPDEFEAPIQNCSFVFHVATPFQHLPNSQYKDIIEATVEATKSIVRACIKARSVKRLIYTASMAAASPLKEDGSGYHDSIDESCWSPLNLPIAFSDDFQNVYLASKTLAEKEIMNYKDWTTQEDDDEGIEVTSLACGIVGGDTLLPYLSASLSFLLATTLLPNNHQYEYQTMRYVEKLLGKLPIVHIEDVCEAHIFCMEHPSICGRYLCASSYVGSSEIGEYCRRMYPEIYIKHEENIKVSKSDIRWGGTKLIEKGFVYKYDMETIIEDSIKTGKRLAQQCNQVVVRDS